MKEPVIKFESYNIDKFIYSHNPIEDMDFKEDFNLDISPSLTDDLTSGLLTVEAKIKAKYKYIYKGDRKNKRLFSLSPLYFFYI